MAQPKPPLDPPQGFVRLGYVVGAHGLAGAVKVRLDNSSSPTIGELARLTLQFETTTVEYRLEAIAPVGRNYVKATLAGVHDRSAAETLKGALVCARVADLPPTRPGEFYYHEIVGYRVSDTDGRVLGEIAEVFFNGAHDVWVVRQGERELLIPVTDEIVLGIDRETRAAVIEPPPGLLD